MTQMGEERGQQVRSRRGRDGDVSYSTRWHCVRGGNNLNSSAFPGVMHAGKKRQSSLLLPPPSLQQHTELQQQEEEEEEQ